jgi:hypothetical protein
LRASRWWLPDGPLSGGRRERCRTYPLREDVFRALERTPPGETKAVIVGQDPYHLPVSSAAMDDPKRSYWVTWHEAYDDPESDL